MRAGSYGFGVTRWNAVVRCARPVWKGGDDIGHSPLVRLVRVLEEPAFGGCNPSGAGHACPPQGRRHH